MVKEIQSSHTQCKLTVMNENDKEKLLQTLFDLVVANMSNQCSGFQHRL